MVFKTEKAKLLKDVSDFCFHFCILWREKGKHGEK